MPALYDTSLSDGAYRLYLVMLDLLGSNGSVWASVAYLAGLRGHTDRQIQRHLHALEKAGLISRWDCSGDCEGHRDAPWSLRHYNVHREQGGDRNVAP